MLKSFFLVLSLLLISFLSYAQYEDYEVDSIVLHKTYKARTIKTISEEIGQDFQDQNNLIRAIYIFLASRMKYDLAFGDEVYKNRCAAKTVEEQNRITDSELERALRLRKGVCWEYSNLFKKLCYYQGIDAEVIPGYRRINDNLPTKPVFNHVYNVVELYGEKKFIDCTFPPPDVYDKSVYDMYYLVDPEEFIFICFPEDANNQFLQKPLTYFQFKNLPLATNDKLLLKVKNVNPAVSNIMVKKGQKTSLSLELGRVNALDEIFVLVNNRNVEDIEVTKTRININIDIKPNDSVKLMGRKKTAKGEVFYNLVNYNRVD